VIRIGSDATGSLDHTERQTERQSYSHEDKDQYGGKVTRSSNTRYSEITICLTVET